MCSPRLLACLLDFIPYILELCSLFAYARVYNIESIFIAITSRYKMTQNSTKNSMDDWLLCKFWKKKCLWSAIMCSISPSMWSIPIVKIIRNKLIGEWAVDSIVVHIYLAEIRKFPQTTVSDWNDCERLDCMRVVKKNHRDHWNVRLKPVAGI